jgi:hypothetical protein
MPERWRNELRKLDHVHPADDLVERAATRPPRPVPAPRSSTRIAIIAFALVIAVAGSYGVFSLIGRGTRETPVGGGEDTGAPVAPANGDLLYAKYVDTGWSLFAVDPDTSQERRLTHGYRDYGSDWSPDSGKIVFDSESKDTGASDIVVANADGSDPVTLGSGYDPAWSPDGSRIAYAGDGGSIWVMNAGGGDAHPVTEGAAAGTGTDQNAAFDWNPAWSPDGLSIAYTRVVGHRYAPLPNGEGSTDVTLQQIRVWHDGPQPSDTMLTDAYANVGELDWSPDGSTIVFTGAPTLFHEASTNGLTWPRVLLIPSNGGPATPISPDEKTWSSGSTWSPDGQWIAFVYDNHSIVVMRPDGSERHDLSVDPGSDEIIGLTWGA